MSYTQKYLPQKFENCLRSYGQSILSDLSEKPIVIDGKKQRDASPATQSNQVLYLLNVWMIGKRFCIAWGKVEDKSDEITGIPQTLDGIDIGDTVVSIEAMSVRREIVKLIVEKKDTTYWIGAMRVKYNRHANIIFKEDACRVKAGYASQNLITPTRRRNSMLFFTIYRD